jgi:hypothetical protein
VHPKRSNAPRRCPNAAARRSSARSARSPTSRRGSSSLPPPRQPMRLRPRPARPRRPRVPFRKPAVRSRRPPGSVPRLRLAVRSVDRLAVVRRDRVARVVRRVAVVSPADPRAVVTAVARTVPAVLVEVVACPVAEPRARTRPVAADPVAAVVPVAAAVLVAVTEAPPDVVVREVRRNGAGRSVVVTVPSSSRLRSGSRPPMHPSPKGRSSCRVASRCRSSRRS